MAKEIRPYSGSKGSFDGLYTFSEVGQIYGIDSSCLRKKICFDKFVVGKDVKKFGKTWLITEQAMVKHFGTEKFENFKLKRLKEYTARNKMIRDERDKIKSEKKSKNGNSMNVKEEKSVDSWINGEIKGREVKSFSF
ncbi:MAG: helix-turn-helix domain-containing protein [Peptostreptococcaceae bacterium]|nr:helix-turn-helix domain-containing protein [Peptostreptococcaceae bacterium]